MWSYTFTSIVLPEDKLSFKQIRELNLLGYDAMKPELWLLAAL
jgi:hypothetical protein